MSDDAGRSRTIRAARKTFDRLARVYGKRGISGLQAAALDALGLGPDDAVLDVGCGPGAAVRAAAGTVRRAVGLDVSPAMLVRARELGGGLPNTEFLEGESDRLPFADGEFTAVLSTSALHHFPDPDATLREVARVLAIQGRVVVGDLSADRALMRVVDRAARLVEQGHVRLYRCEEMAGLLDRAGFADVTGRTLPGGRHAIVRASKR